MQKIPGPTCHLASLLKAVLFGLAVCKPVQGLGIPAGSGQYHVGFTKQIIEHLNTNDPLAPNNVSSEFLATVYYPTLQKPGDAQNPYLTPEVAAYMEQSWNYANETLESLTSNLQEGAPYLKGIVGQSQYPTLLFGPGAGEPTTEGNTILISELASHGYVVIGLDHPYEAPFLRYPNGTGVQGVEIDFTSLELVEAIYDTRLVDNKALLKSLPELVEKLQAPINTTLIGLLGYSIGDAAAIRSLYLEDHVMAALNMDGQLFGQPTLNSTEADAKKPVMLLGNMNHTGSPDYDATWGTFPTWQTGYMRKMLVTGSRHRDFSDGTLWKTIWPTDPSAGTIDGHRMVRIVNAYVKAFFDFTLLRQNSLILDGPAVEWPEVVFYDETDNPV